MIVQVIYPISIDTDKSGIIVDKTRLDDADYITELQKKIKVKADKVLWHVGGIQAVIDDCDDCPELIE